MWYIKSGWKTNGTRCIMMYSCYCEEERHDNQRGADCTVYQKNLYHLAQYQGTAAHEFGHVFGLWDMYYYATINHGYEPIANEEIKYNENRNIFGLPQANGIMKCNGKACANDIEMLILAFSENTWQYFVPYGTNQVLSKAIKCPVQYRLKGSKNSVYVWDDDTKDFIKNSL